MRILIFLAGVVIGLAYGSASLQTPVNIGEAPHYHGTQSTVGTIDLQPAQGSDGPTPVQPQAPGVFVQSAAALQSTNEGNTLQGTKQCN